MNILVPITVFCFAAVIVCFAVAQVSKRLLNSKLGFIAMLVLITVVTALDIGYIIRYFAP